MKCPICGSSRLIRRLVNFADGYDRNRCDCDDCRWVGEVWQAQGLPEPPPLPPPPLGSAIGLDITYEDAQCFELRKMEKSAARFLRVLTKLRDDVRTLHSPKIDAPRGRNGE